MRIGARTGLALYVAAIFTLLPLTPRAVGWANASVGRWASLAPAAAALAGAAALLARRLLRSPRPAPGPHLALAGILAAALAAGLLLVSSPIGLVHLPQYGGLAALACRAIGARAGAAVAGGAAAAGVGLLDEVVQGVVPNRVFDWWDVALNAAGAAVGAACWAWWRWTGGGGAAGPRRDDPGP